ncbi:MAG: hypothetical protein JXR37_22435 [Kiritimatiellae bacterium]|nr:hypothetical protein [Kiritimatiellia bacterium]
MTGRERVTAALAFEAPDRAPVEYHHSPAGMYEHGTALQQLMCRHGQDFGDPAEFAIPEPSPDAVDGDGRYYEVERDMWGTLWEHRIFGIAGHPLERPLDDWGALPDWRPPAPPAVSGPLFEADRAKARAYQERFFLKSGWVSIFEVLHGIRRFEDVLVDIALDSAEINELADRIVGYQEQAVRYLLERGVDALQFADDFGTQEGLLLSPDLWRRFFRPRYARLIRPVKEAGKKVLFHTCGLVDRLLPDLAELGCDAVWPQIGLYDADRLAAMSRDLHLAVAIHPDRSHLMTFGSPADVRATVHQLAKTFRTAEGGSWFYVEIDNGFPFENVRALIETISELS